MATIIQGQHRGNHDRNQRWARVERAALFERYDELRLQGFQIVSEKECNMCDYFSYGTYQILSHMLLPDSSP